MRYSVEEQKTRFPISWTKDRDEYLKANFPKNKGLYDRLNDAQRETLENYFRWRTKYLFYVIHEKMGELHIKPSKVEKLKELRADANDWVFDGIVDRGSTCSKCTLGHALRYEYYAFSPSLRKRIIFGSTCAGDFFDVSNAQLKELVNIKDLVFNEVKGLLYILYAGKIDSYMKSINYSYVVKGLFIESLNDVRVTNHLKETLKDAYPLFERFVKCGLPLPTCFINPMLDIVVELERTKNQVTQQEASTKVEDKDLPFYSEEDEKDVYKARLRIGDLAKVWESIDNAFANPKIPDAVRSICGKTTPESCTFKQFKFVCDVYRSSGLQKQDGNYPR
jgi:hypothetical protein